MTDLPENPTPQEDGSGTLLYPLLRITSYNVCYTKLLRMGGFGFMEEVDLQIYHRRTKAAEQAYGDGIHHRERIASLIGL